MHLDGALAEGFACGGWCPANRQAEDGIIPEHYPLTPLVDAGYRRRTRQNVMDSDATIIIFHGEIRTPSGTALTLKTCIQKHKPHLLIDAWQLTPEQAAYMMVQFVHDHSIQTLNFGGSRESVASGIQVFTEQSVRLMLQILKNSG